MQKKSLNFIPLAPLVAAFAVSACQLRTDTRSVGGHPSVETQVAMVSGQLDIKDQVHFAGLHDLDCRVAGTSVRVSVQPDGSFLLRDVPTGDVQIQCTALDATFAFSLRGIQAGAVVFVTVVLDQTPSTVVQPPPGNGNAAPPPAPDDHGRFNIGQNGAVIDFSPGTIDGTIVITGNHVTVVGLGSSCAPGAHVVLAGDLIIRGDDVVVVGITVQGQVTITGKNARVLDDCGSGEGPPVTPAPDAGVRADAGTPDAAAQPVMDAGAPPPAIDAGAPPPAIDAGPPPAADAPQTPTGSVLAIRDNNVEIAISAGLHDESIIILGSNVSVIGELRSCADGEHAAITGDLVIDGINAQVTNVTVLGHTEVAGSNAVISDACR
jgi:hypothetical protein